MPHPPNRMQKVAHLTAQRRGLSLFELLVVLVIAFILVGIGWVMTRPAVTQTRISRVRDDHRTVARAISNYQADYSERPQTLATLAKQEGYMTAFPRDPFQPGGGGYAYLPALFPGMPALLISVGPDGDLDLPAELLAHADLSQVARASGVAQRAESASLPEENPMTAEAAMGLVTNYLFIATYNSERGGDGDVITVLH